MNVLSARYGNDWNTLDAGVIIVTDEIGDVATSTEDAPSSGGAWEALMAWIASGNTVAPYTPPE
jgi:hypothetical protein